MEMNSVQTQEVSDSTETVKENLVATTEVAEVPDEAAEKMPEGYKNDFFKQKEIARKAKAEKEALLAKVKAYEEKENIEKGNFQTIIDTLKEENKTLKDTLTNAEKQKKLAKFNEKLTSKAEELGFVKPKQILNFISKEDMGLLKIDEEYNVDDTGMEIAFQNIKKEWGQLFKPKEVKIADAEPVTNLNQKAQKSVKDMTSSERIALALELSRKKKE